jgi:5-methylcytosine-specific restriction endonuclease McrA
MAKPKPPSGDVIADLRRAKRAEYMRKWYAKTPQRMNAQSKRYHEANREKVAAQVREYRAAHQEEDAERHRIYYAVNRDKLAERNRKWREVNRDKVVKYYREYSATHSAQATERARIWNASHPEVGRTSSRQRRARKKNSSGTITTKQTEALYQRQCGKCAACKAELNGKYHLDHIMPLALGGSHTIDNAQILCPPCNL